MMMIFIGTLFCNLHRDANGLYLRQKRRRRRRSLLRIVHARGAIPNEMGSARCRATPALRRSLLRIGAGGGVYLDTREAEEECTYNRTRARRDS